MTLFEIQAQLAEAIEGLFDNVDPETGEVDAGSIQALEELQEARDEKLEGCGAYIKNLEAEAKAIKEEADRLKKRAEQKQKNADRIREYVSNILQAAGETKFESAKVVFSFRKSEALNITDEEKLPAAYMVTKTETAPDKAAIKKALKAGELIEGAEIITKQNLQVK